MSEHPLISVIIPTCGRPADLARCLDRLSPSCQGLDAARFEVIVSDDAHSEETRDLISREFEWARWVAGPAAGPAANRNNGARHSRGKWLVFTDDDCVPSERWLGAYQEAISSGLAVALEGRVISEPGPRSPWDEAPLNSSGGCFWSCNIAIDREVFWRVGAFDENYTSAAMEDVDLRRALITGRAAVAFVPDAVVNHPARRGDLRLKLAHMRRFESHVYYLRKWEGPHPLRLYASVARALVRHWLITPLRRRGFLLAALFPLAVAHLTLMFLPWYQRAGKRLELRRAQ